MEDSSFKQAQNFNNKKLELSELSFRTVAETATDAIIIANQNSIIIFTNSKVREIFGYTEGELLGQHLHTIMPPKYREDHLRGVERFLKTGDPRIIGHTTELEALKKDGTIFPIELSLSFWREDESIFFTGIIRDISKRIKSKEELKESQYLIQKIANTSPAIISVYDLQNHRIVYINKRVTEVLGYTKDDLQEMGDEIGNSIVHPNDLKKITERNGQLSKERISDLNIRVKDADGVYRWIFAKYTVFNRNREGEIQRILIIAFDITDQKAMENRYRLFIEGVKDYAMFMMDTEGNITSWNEGAKRMKGYEEKEIIGKNFSIFYPKEAIEKKYPEFELQEAQKKGRYEDEGWRIRKDGTQFYANVIITPIYNGGQTLLGFSKITRDLTATKNAEEKITKLNAELEQKVNERTEQLSHTVMELKKINNDLDNFVYTASHDLKGPIFNIEGLIHEFETSEYFSERPDEIGALFDMIDESIEKFKGIILDLGEISKVRNSFEDSMEEIDISKIINETFSLIKDSIECNKAKIDVDLKVSKLLFSRTNFRSIIYNLLSNAIKYRDPQRKPEIEIKTERKDGYILLSVKDNGLGIEEKNKDKIFEMFQRLHTNVDGTGVGLFIVKRIIDNAEAKIEVKSTVGKGSVFTIYFKDSLTHE